jgi:hypothetical protein
MDLIDRHFFKDNIVTGVDAKILQYDTQISDIVTDQINLTKILTSMINPVNINTSDNCILINIEKDVERYKSSVIELKKLSINNFVHLKATYWKNRSILETDMTFVLNFLKQFIPTINTQKIIIDMFSELNDTNIYIQDGPLACYCSHLRSMIYGYLHFTDYTILIEDDISVVNTANIEKYIKCIPEDWDIICFNSIPKKFNFDNNVAYYKFTDYFHSTHFYIIRNSSMEKLFTYLYPIFDQVDVLISKSIHELNIYNIPNTVYQKSLSTNTQNNMHVILSSPHYDVVRVQLDIIKQSLKFFTELIIPDNKFNDSIISFLMSDILYKYITDSNNIKNISNDDLDVKKYFVDDRYSNYPEYTKLFTAIGFVIQCSKKGIKIKEEAAGLTHNMLTTISQFTFHNTVDTDTGELLKAYSYGSTSHTYLLEQNNIILKIYDDNLRWKIDNHNNISDIFNKEVDALKKQNYIKLYSYDEKNKIIRMSYGGSSLYNKFILPEDWELQIKNIFEDFTKNDIYYPEFRLQNILILDNKISFVDFGLIMNQKNADNSNNCLIFTKLLRILNDRLKNIDNHEKCDILYNTMINNIKTHNMTEYLNNIF